MIDNIWKKGSENFCKRYIFTITGRNLNECVVNLKSMSNCTYCVKNKDSDSRSTRANKDGLSPTCFLVNKKNG